MGLGWIPSTIALASLLAFTVCPFTARAQAQSEYTDLRKKTGYTTEDLARFLFSKPEPQRATRGYEIKESSSRPTSTRVALNVFFEFNSDEILPLYYPDLNKLGAVLSQSQYAAYAIRIAGYTDNVGPESYNQRLSERRAESVKRYLEQHFHIDAGRLIARGYGETQPIAQNDTPEGQAQNRRVEVVNLGR